MTLRNLAREIAAAVARGPAEPAAPIAPATTTVTSTARATEYRSPRHEQLEARRARCRAYWASQEAREEQPDDVIDGDRSLMVAGEVQDPEADRAELAANGGRFLGQTLEERLVGHELVAGDRAAQLAAYNERQREAQTEAARRFLAGREQPAEARTAQAQAPDGGGRVLYADGRAEDWADRKAVS